jgi:hypothetical protein
MRRRKTRKHLELTRELERINREIPQTAGQGTHTNPRHERTYRVPINAERHAMNQQLHEIERGADPDALAG